MAEPQKVTVSPNRLDSSSLPEGLTNAYYLYLMRQSSNIQNIANASNNANDLAYQATIKNEEQDVTLTQHSEDINSLNIVIENHELRITANTSNISSLTVRVANAEGQITTINTNLSSLTTRIGNSESAITTIQGDYISKATTTSQSLSSALNVSTSYSVDGTKVVGSRVTGWTPSTGSPRKTGYWADQTYTASPSYVQSEIAAIANGLTEIRQVVKALEDADRSHGLID